MLHVGSFQRGLAKIFVAPGRFFSASQKELGINRRMIYLGGQTIGKETPTKNIGII
jgi:hypothetical protein